VALFFLFFGVLWGRAIGGLNAATTAAREGARTYAVTRDENLAKEKAWAALASFVSIPSGVAAGAEDFQRKYISVTEQDGYVTVTVVYPCPNPIPRLAWFTGQRDDRDILRLAGRATFMVERPPEEGG
jgi:hypothetical protein